MMTACTRGPSTGGQFAWQGPPAEAACFEIVVANPFHDDRTLSQIFRDLPERETYPYSRAGKTPAAVLSAEINDPTSFDIFGEHTYHGINFRSSCGRAPFRPCVTGQVACTTGGGCLQEGNHQCPAVMMPNTVKPQHGYVGINEKCHWAYGAASKVKRGWTPLTDSFVPGIFWNAHAWYHTNRPEARGRVRLGVWSTGKETFSFFLKFCFSPIFRQFLPN